MGSDSVLLNNTTFNNMFGNAIFGVYFKSKQAKRGLVTLAVRTTNYVLK